MIQRDRQRLYVNVIVTFGRQFAAGFMRLFLTLLVARILGPEGAGAYAVALLLPTLMAQLLNLGMAASNVYFIATGRFTKEQVWATSRNVALLASLAGVLSGLLLVNVAGARVFPGVSTLVLSVALVTLPPLLILGAVASIFQAEEDFSAYNVINLAEPTLSLCAILSIAFLGIATIESVAIATVISHVFATILAVTLLSKTVRVFCRGKRKRQYLAQSLRYGVVAHASNVTSFLNYRLDLFLVNFFAGPLVAGVYAIAIRVAEQIWIISQAVSTVIFPRLAAMVDDEEGRRNLTPIIARATLWATLLASGVVAAVGRPLVEVMFGTEFQDAAFMLLLLLPGITVFSCSRVLANDLAARGLVGVNLALAIGALVLNAAGNILLIPYYGALGAAAVTSTAYAADLLVRLVIQHKFTGVDWTEMVLPRRQDFWLLRRILASASKLMGFRT